MTLILDPVRASGDWSVAVLSETVIRARQAGGGVFATGSKRPVAVVVHDGAALHAMDLKGRPLDVTTLEEGCPGLRAAFCVDQVSGDQSMSGPAGTIPSGLRNSDGEK